MITRATANKIGSDYYGLVEGKNIFLKKPISKICGLCMIKEHMLPQAEQIALMALEQTVYSQV